MSKKKAVFVTALMALMLALIIIGLYLLKYRAYMVVLCVLAVFGFVGCGVVFCRWISKESPLLPMHVADDEYIPDESFSATYDEIKAELDHGKPEEWGLDG